MNIPREALEISALLICSTAHLTEQEANGLLEESNVRGISFTIADEYFLEAKLWIDQEEDPEGRDIEPSEGLAAVMAVAKAHGIERIRFDRDAPQIPGLPTYSW